MSKTSREPGTIRLGDLRTRETSCTAVYEGDTFVLRYRPHVLTAVFLDAIEAEIDKAQTNGQVLAAYKHALSDLLAGWNLVGADDQELPVNEETLGSVGQFALRVFWQSIIGHMSPNAGSAAG